MEESHDATSRMWIVALIGLAVLVAGIAGLLRLWIGTAASHQMGPGPIPGLIAPDFSARSSTGQSIRLAEFRGRPVVLAFLALQSEPCRAAAPDLQAVQTKNGRRVAVLGLVQDTPAAAQEFATHYKLSFPLLLDDAGRIAALYHVRDVPTLFVVNAKGVVAQVIAGPFTRDSLNAALEALPAPKDDFGPTKDFF